MSSQIDDRTRLAGPEANFRNLDLAQRLLVGAGVLGGLAASSCCLVPLALFGLGVSGAWIGYVTRLAPYQPYFLGFAAVCLGLGYWLRHRSRKAMCAQDEVCARTLPTRIVMTSFAVAGVLILAAVTLDLLAPFFL